jgi:predicted enzyme related to lactoylglutathione lyase
MKFNSILIGSEDPRRLQDYYTKLFGQPTFEDGGYFGWRLGDSAVTFGPHDEVKGQNREPGRILWNLETADVKGEFEKLRRAGAQVVREPYNMGEDGGEFWIATLKDPDNNYFQLMSPMPEASDSSSTTSAGSTSRRGG